MTYQLYLGDCLEEMNRIEDGSIDMILADLPYGTTACKWDIIIPFEPLWAHYKRVIKKRGAVVLFGSEPFSSFLRLSNLEWYKYDWVWDKIIGSNFQLANYQPLKRHESILVFSASPTSYVKNGDCMIYNPQMFKTDPANIRPLKNRKQGQNMIRIHSANTIHQSPNDISFPTSIITINKFRSECNPAANKLHPTQKPVALLEYLIRTYTNSGELVLDNTMGSGSTGEACLREGRRFVGIEKDEGYYQIAVNRLAKVAAELRGEYVPKPARGKIEDLPMFAEMKA